MARQDQQAATDRTLTEQQLQLISKLKARDREVRTHEASHLAAAGRFARGGAQFEFTRGPDGVSYAVGGEVSIDTAPVSGNPQATLLKAQTIRRAALAPADPSGQDQSVAAAATAMATKARAELSRLAAGQRLAESEIRPTAGEPLSERLQRSGSIPSPAPQIDLIS